MSSTATLTRLPTADWQADIRAARITTAQLLDAVGITPETLPYGLDFTPDFALKVPPHYLSLITPGDPHDPLLRQVLARAEERLDVPGTSTDPLHEADFTAGARHHPQIWQPRAADGQRRLRHPLPLLLPPPQRLWRCRAAAG